MRRLFSLLLCIFCATAPGRGQEAFRPTVILVSIDGWRWDYHLRFPVPHLTALIQRGVRSEGLVPSFPTKTFPNHYTIVTGLYPGRHGIVANNILDPPSGRLFAIGRREEVRDAMWWGGEPVWVTAEAAGQKTAPVFWVGSEAPIGHRRPAYWSPFDDKVDGRERVDRVLALLDKPAPERPTFLTLYFDVVDTAGHRDGPDSQAVRQAATQVDRHLGRLVDGLRQRQLLDAVNVIVVSDHGMAAASRTRVVVLDDYISLEDVQVVDLNPTLGLVPQQSRGDAVYRALRRAHPRLHVYRRNETPRHWRYREHPRIPPLVGVVDEGWQIMTRRDLERIERGTSHDNGGQHGYDPRTARSMRGLFVAAGPAFKAAMTVAPFENVHVYPMLARILGVTPASGDGSPAMARRIMR